MHKREESFQIHGICLGIVTEDERESPRSTIKLLIEYTSHYQTGRARYRFYIVSTIGKSGNAIVCYLRNVFCHANSLGISFDQQRNSFAFIGILRYAYWLRTYN